MPRMLKYLMFVFTLFLLIPDISKAQYSSVDECIEETKKIYAFNGFARSTALEDAIQSCYLKYSPTSFYGNGACSDHSGINCQMGPDVDGSVICNDGYRDSTVFYSSVDLCRTSYSTLSNSNTSTCPIFSTLDSTTNTCKCDSGYVTNSDSTGCISGILYCSSIYGTMSVFDAKTQTCSCLSGYAFGTSGKCEKQDILISIIISKFDPKNNEILFYTMDANKTLFYFRAKPAISCPFEPITNSLNQVVTLNLGYDNLVSNFDILSLIKGESCQLSVTEQISESLYNSYFIDKTVTAQPSSTTTLNENVFSDVTDSTLYKDAILYIKTKGIVGGYVDGTFKPEKIINRAEFIKILVGAKFGEPDSTNNLNCFKDVDLDQWFTKYICFAKKEAIIQGYSDGTFKPNQEINYAEALKMILETYKLVDSSSSTPWFQKYVDKAKTLKVYIEGLTIDKKLTRGEMAETIYRVLINQI